MKLNLEDPKISFAVNIAKEASQIGKKVKNDIGFNTLSKNDQSPVTIADFSIQALVSARLNETFPGDGLIGEESADFLRKEENKEILQTITSIVKEFIPESTNEKVCEWIDHSTSEGQNRYWTLDPIDGTKGYLRNDQYAMALALIENGQVQLGVLGCPHLKDGYIEDNDGPGSLLIAGKNQGCWLSDLESQNEWKSLKVSDQSNIQQSIMMRSKEKYHTSLSKIDILLEKLQTTQDPIAMDSQAKYSVLATGKSDFLVRFLSEKHLDYKEKIWDQAAGAIVLEEAGGKITDLYGKDLDFGYGKTLKENTGIVASNGNFHKEIIQSIEQNQLILI